MRHAYCRKMWDPKIADIFWEIGESSFNGFREAFHWALLGPTGSSQMCLGAVSGDWVDWEAPKGIFSLVSGVCYICSAFLEAGREEETSTPHLPTPPPPPSRQCCWMVWNCRSCWSGTGQVKWAFRSITAFGAVVFFPWIASLLWKRWKGGPGNLSGQRIQTSNGVESVYH